MRGWIDLRATVVPIYSKCNEKPLKGFEKGGGVASLLWVVCFASKNKVASPPKKSGRVYICVFKRSLWQLVELEKRKSDRKASRRLVRCSAGGGGAEVEGAASVVH